MFGKIQFSVTILLVLIFLSLSISAQVDKCLVNGDIRNEIIMELSGEKALEYIINLTGWAKNRTAEEYEGTFFETDYLLKEGKKAGFEDIHAEFFDGGKVWDAEEGDLYVVSPYKTKVVSINEIPACLAKNSRTTKIDEAELIYVGEGTRSGDYKDIDVEGKIVLASGFASAVHSQAVIRRKALGVITKGSYPSMGDYPLPEDNQVGWTRIADNESSTFTFILTEKLWNRLYRMRNMRLKMGVNVKTKYYPFKLNLVTATIPGVKFPNEEMIYVAHVFEGIDKQGANDNASGAACILEIGRTLNKLISEGKIPPLKRTLRFLWVDEFASTRPYLRKHKELWDKIICALNFDMVGEDLYKCDSYLRMKMPPDSRFGYLNDIIANMLEFVDKSDIRTPTGNNGPFNYRLVSFIGASDHVLFIQYPIGVTGMQFNHWTDNFYHTSEDRPDKSDPTELKRVGIMAACAYHLIGTAEEKEAKEIAWEIVSRGSKRMDETTRQVIKLLNDKDNLKLRYKAAVNKIEQCFVRESSALESVYQFSENRELKLFVGKLSEQLRKQKDVNIEKFNIYYEEITGLKPEKTSLTEEEKQYEKVIPEYVLRPWTEEHTKAARTMRSNYGNLMRVRGDARFEVENFINGKKTILDIYRAVDAEFGGVVQGAGRTPLKFQYEIDPGFGQIKLKDVADYITAMEKAGIVRFK